MALDATVIVAPQLKRKPLAAVVDRRGGARVSREVVLGSTLAVLFLLPFRGAASQDLSLPPGALTEWIVEGPEEIVTQIAFDPSTVMQKLPKGLIFQTLSELAAGGNRDVQTYLERHPDHAEWGWSFLEIVRQEVFEIDGRKPDLAPGDAFALWVSRVRPCSDQTDLPRGRLLMEFWVSDRDYAAYMRRKGHYATYGEVQLAQTADGLWEGRIRLDSLEVNARCQTSREDQPRGAGSAFLYMPADFAGEVTGVGWKSVGHRRRACVSDDWQFSGWHPIVVGSKIAGSGFQFGYSLRGGLYRR